MNRRCFACILAISLLCSLLAGCAGRSESGKTFPNVFDKILSPAKHYLVWDSSSPDEYCLCTTTRYISLENGNSVTSLEGLLNVLAEADCHMFGRKINESLTKAAWQSVDEINSNIEAGKRMLADIKDNCRLAVYALDSIPDKTETLKIESVNYALFLAKDFESSDSSEAYKQQNRWVLLGADGDMIVAGSGSYKGLIDSWWDMQKTVFNAPEQLIKYGSDAVKIELKSFAAELN